MILKVFATVSVAVQLSNPSSFDGSYFTVTHKQTSTNIQYFAHVPPLKYSFQVLVLQGQVPVLVNLTSACSCTRMTWNEK
jgi:hypothetical protein